MVKQLSISSIGTNILDLGVKSRYVELELSHFMTQKSGCSDDLARNESQSLPYIIIYYIILIMRFWKGQTAVNCFNQAKHIRSWCEK